MATAPYSGNGYWKSQIIVCGLGALLGIAGGPIAIVLGVLTRREVAGTRRPGGTLAIVAIVIGAISFVASLLLLIL